MAQLSSKIKDLPRKINPIVTTAGSTVAANKINQAKLAEQITSSDSYLERAKQFFLGRGNVDDKLNEELIEALAAQNVLDAKDYNLFNGNLLASLNLNPVSVQQVDCFLEPGIFFQKVIETHSPTRVSLQPIVAVFDDKGGLSGITQSDNSGTLVLETTSESIQDYPDFKQIGWFFRFVQYNTERGKSSLQIQTNAINAAFDVDDLGSEARLVVLTTNTDNTLSVSQGTPTVGDDPKDVSISPAIQGATRDLTAFLEVASSKEETLDLTAMTLRAQNLNVYAYPIVVTREVVERIADLFAADGYDELAANFLDFI